MSYEYMKNKTGLLIEQSIAYGFRNNNISFILLCYTTTYHTSHVGVMTLT